MIKDILADIMNRKSLVKQKRNKNIIKLHIRDFYYNEKGTYNS